MYRRCVEKKVLYSWRRLPVLAAVAAGEEADVVAVAREEAKQRAVARGRLDHRQVRLSIRCAY